MCLCTCIVGCYVWPVLSIYHIQFVIGGYDEIYFFHTVLYNSKNFAHYIPTLIGNYVVTQSKQQIYTIHMCVYVYTKWKGKTKTK